jgi:hypothetical protein
MMSCECRKVRRPAADVTPPVPSEVEKAEREGGGHGLGAAGCAQLAEAMYSLTVWADSASWRAMPLLDSPWAIQVRQSCSRRVRSGPV